MKKHFAAHTANTVTLTWSLVLAGLYWRRMKLESFEMVMPGILAAACRRWRNYLFMLTVISAFAKAAVTRYASEIWRVDLIWIDCAGFTTMLMNCFYASAGIVGLKDFVQYV